MTNDHIAAMTEFAYGAATNVAKVDVARNAVANMLVNYPHYSAKDQKLYRDTVKQLDDLARAMRDRMTIKG